MKVQLPIAGRWYFGLMIMLGGVSLTSLNNVVYLMEALLISGLLVSAILSARIARSVTAEVRRRPITAKGENKDIVHVVNHGRFPVFCLEVDEWSNEASKRLAFIPYITGYGSVLVPCRAVYDRRGAYTWQAISVGTTFPYGFLRFLQRTPKAGARIVWPAASQGGEGDGTKGEGNAQNSSGTAYLEGEVRPMNYDDDPRSIVWTLSARGGDFMVRMRAAERHITGLSLDLREEPGERFERKISEIATRLYEVPVNDSECFALTVFNREGRKRIHGRNRILDSLATIEAEGPFKEAG